MVVAAAGALLTAIRVDVRRLHDGWMGLVFPRQRLANHNVLGRWRPQTLSGRISYWTWYAIGAPLVVLLYPLVLAGFVIRFQATRVDSTATRLGVLGVVVASLVVWGLLTAVAYIQLPWAGFLAVAAAAGAATVSAVLAFGFSRIGGRGTTILFAYPFAMTALFLPPVVAALVTPSLEPYILDPSYAFAVWLLQNPLALGGLNEFLWANFTLEGAAYVGMWIGIAFPLGWILGVLVTLADLVRPSSSREEETGARGSPSGD